MRAGSRFRLHGPGRSAVLLATAVLGLAGCSGDGDSDTEGSAPEVTTTSVAGEMRDVPTLPPSTLEGQTASSDGVIVAAPTLVPPAPAPIDPEIPSTNQPPPSTELVGDPQPAPATTALPLPPLPDDAPPLPDACVRLDEFVVVDLVAAAGGGTVTTEVLSEDACRLTSGPVLVEVHFVELATVREDWYGREGIEPVGEVGGDAVGLRSFITPAGESGSGYTIAVVGGRAGVVVAAAGTADARKLAGDITILAQQSA